MEPLPKSRITAIYDAASDHFDAPALAYRWYCGRQIAARAHLQPGEVVLDVCCGTGASAIPAAHAVGSAGRVIGLDISPAMIAAARERAATESLAHMEFRHADFDQAYFRNGSFDAVLCGFGIAFFPDLRSSLYKMWRLLRAGGRLVAATWAPGRYEPANTVFWEAVRQIRPDLYKDQSVEEPLADPDRLRAAFETAGIPTASIEFEDYSQPLTGPGDWWSIALGSGRRATLDAMNAEERDRLQAACSQIAGAIRIPVLYATAAKSG
ncbi:MAG: methyltransferase domain-containing protein [Acidobacteriota bacterium]|nr:methyltransferase domain-containing protein [Acidobacteriota bacterium]